MQTTPTPAQARNAARNIGRFGAKHWPAARKAMPKGSTIQDYRNLCARAFLDGMNNEAHFLLHDLLVGFEREAKARYPLETVNASCHGRGMTSGIA
jgi:hypothetical protein